MRDFYGESGYPLPEQAATETLASLIRRPSLGRVYLMEVKGESAGYAVLTIAFSMEFGAMRGFVDDLFVAPSFRRAGLGAEVLGKIERDAMALGAGALLVETSSENVRAVSVYARAGFRDSGRMLMSKALGAPVHERA